MLKIYKYKIIILLIFIFFFITPVIAKTIHLDKSLKKMSIGHYIDYLEDNEKRLTLENILSEEYNNKWTASQKKSPGFGYTKSNYWVRFNVKNNADEDMEFFLEQNYSLTNKLTLYIPEEKGFKKIEAGDTRPFSERPYYHRTFVFPLSLKAGSTSTYYLLFDSESAMNIVLRIWSPSVFKIAASEGYYLLMLFYGIILIMVVYNLFVYFFVRRIEYLYYVFFIMFFIFLIMAFHGTAFQFFFPDYPFIRNNFINTSTFLTEIFGILFFIRFLDLDKIEKKLKKTANIFLVIAGIRLILNFFIPYRISLNIQAFFLYPLLLFSMFTGIKLVIKRQRNAYFYVISWSAFLLGTLIFIMKNDGIIQSSFLTEWSLPIGATVMIVLLSIALADRMNILRKKLQVSKDELADMNLNLEKKVDERTSELMASKNKAEESDRLKSAFLANVSHEIRTPMTAIIGYSDLLLQDEISNEHRDYLETIQKSGNLLLSIINNILDISKIEANQLIIEQAPFSLKETISNVEAEGKILISRSNKKILFKRSCADNISDFITGDPVRLQQVLNNLISNAVKFTNDGSIKIGISLKDENTLEFHVSDTGIGVPLEKQKKIFERFIQADLYIEKNYGGTGLGLTITKKLVELMNGEIYIKSNSPDGQGTTFTFTLPYKPAKEHVHKQKSEKSTPGKTNHNKILIVEDNKESKRLVQKLLEKSGFITDTAVNGEEAISKFNNDPDINLILMDIQMPVMDGLEATRKIRKYEQTHNINQKIPIIALTAGAMKGDMEKALFAGCDDFITKPIDRSLLMTAIDKFINKV